MRRAEIAAKRIGVGPLEQLAHTVATNITRETDNIQSPIPVGIRQSDLVERILPRVRTSNPYAVHWTGSLFPAVVRDQVDQIMKARGYIRKGEYPQNIVYWSKLPT